MSAAVFAKTTEGLVCFCMTVEDRRIKLWQVRKPLFQYFTIKQLVTPHLAALRQHPKPTWNIPAGSRAALILWMGESLPGPPRVLLTAQIPAAHLLFAPDSPSPAAAWWHPGLLPSVRMCPDNTETQREHHPVIARQNQRCLQASWRSLVSDWFGVSSFLGTNTHPCGFSGVYNSTSPAEIQVLPSPRYLLTLSTAFFYDPSYLWDICFIISFGWCKLMNPKMARGGWGQFIQFIQCVASTAV